MTEPTEKPQLLTVQLRHVLHVVRQRLLLGNADELADTLGISRSNVYRIRNGGTPSFQTLEMLAYFVDFGCSLEESPEPQANGKGPALPPSVHPAMQPATAQPPSNQPARPPWE